MANKPLYSTNNKPLYSTNNRPVYSDMVMPYLKIDYVRTGNSDSLQRAFLLFGFGDLTGIYISDYTVSKWFMHFGSYSFGIAESWSRSALLDFVNDNQHGGWAWNGTYWQVHYVGWTKNAGTSGDVTFTAMGHTLSLSHTFAVREPGATVNPAADLICTLRYTPSTDVLEFV